MPKIKKQQKIRDPDAYGAFMPDGSYFIDAPLAQRGAADRFVRAMVKSRNGPGFSPETASEAIVLAKQTAAFPNHRQWAGNWSTHLVGCDAPCWSDVWTSTAAEEAVKRCGLGASSEEKSRHWCGERWIEGAEKSCESPAHRRSLEVMP